VSLIAKNRCRFFTQSSSIPVELVEPLGHHAEACNDKP
jgi:hypothetical protein